MYYKKYRPEIWWESLPFILRVNFPCVIIGDTIPSDLQGSDEAKWVSQKKKKKEKEEKK